MNEERINILNRFISEEPENPFNRYALAMEYYEADENKSLTLLEDLIEHHSDYLPTYFKLAHLYMDMEKWDKAGEIFENGIVLAEKQNDSKALSELKSAYQNFQFERD